MAGKELSDSMKVHIERTSENCAEVGDNTILQEAGKIYLSYSCEIGKLVKDMSYTEAVRLFRVCELAKGNNCNAYIYYAIKELKDSLIDIIQWHKFNNRIHEIELK